MNEDEDCEAEGFSSFERLRRGDKQRKLTLRTYGHCHGVLITKNTSFLELDAPEPQKQFLFGLF